MREQNAQWATSAVGAWVKMPGLQPNETNALNYLTLDQLSRLQARVEKAIDQAKAKAASTLRPGDVVQLSRRPFASPLDVGSVGVVIGRADLVGETYHPSDTFPVAWVDRGIWWVRADCLTVLPINTIRG